MTYGRKKKDRKKNKTVRLKESDLKRLEVVSRMYEKTQQEIVETAIINVLDELEEQYIKTVKERKKVV